MADTQRTRAALISLLADNVTGQISAQDLRDFLVTVMPAEFAFADDFWVEPFAAQLTANGGRGAVLYSQIAGSDISIYQVCYLASENLWKLAVLSESIGNVLMAVALISITSGDSGDLLKRGLVRMSNYSGIFLSQDGCRVLLRSGTDGSLVTSILNQTLERVIGYVVDDLNGIYYFDPDWAVVGA